MKDQSKERQEAARPGAFLAASAAVGAAAGSVLHTLGRVRRLIGSGFALAGLRVKGPRFERKPPGASPGIESTPEADIPPAPGLVKIRCIDYGPNRCETSQPESVEALAQFPRPEGCGIRWINVDGLHPFVVKQLKDLLQFHTLAAEDVLNSTQRPKVEVYEDHLFLVLRMLMLQEGTLRNEQVSIFYFRDTVLTFQEQEGDVWDPIRSRLANAASRLRSHDASYLLYALLDAMVDHCFPILEAYGDLLESLEKDIVENPSPATQQRLHGIKRELILLRRAIWPLREVLNQLTRNENDFISPYSRNYLRDVYDHGIQLIDMIETYREMTAGLNDLYMSSVGNRMNEIMKVLTIMASFFIPVTFIAGVYGMNFEHIPELRWKYSYAGFWAACAGVSLALAWFFVRKGWIGRK